jgi:hypothetical protein
MSNLTATEVPSHNGMVIPGSPLGGEGEITGLSEDPPL